MYAMPALPLKSKQLDELNVCWNNVIRMIFNYNKSESVIIKSHTNSHYECTRRLLYRYTTLLNTNIDKHKISTDGNKIEW